MVRLALAAAALALVALACGSSPPSTEELQEQLSSIPAQPADPTIIEPDASWAVAREGQLDGTAFDDLSEGLLATAVTESSAQPIDGYERVLENSTAVVAEQPYPAVAYSVALLFESNGHAAAFYEAALAAARATDWLAASPVLDGETPEDPETGELPLAISEVVDDLLWQQSTAIAGGRTVTEDLLLVRDGRIVVIVRGSGSFAGDDVRLGSTSAFEAGLVIPVAERLHNAVD